MPHPAWIDDLSDPEGQELLEILADESFTPATELQTITRLRAKYPKGLVESAVRQAKLRRRARAKFVHADRMFFTEAGLEQASSDRMAKHHAERFRPFVRIADLCTGIGGDLTALASRSTVLAVDKDEIHIRLAMLNAAAYGVAQNVSALTADVRDVSLTGIDAVFIDPARRRGEQRLSPGASEPPLEWCFATSREVAALGVKASPTLPLEVPPPEWEVELVSEGRELKETMLWSPSLSTSRRRATILPTGASLTPLAGDPLPVQAPGQYLIDPDPAVTRAGLVEDLGRSLTECWKIDERIAFLSADSPLVTPFGRTLTIEASMPWNLRRLREALRALKIGVVDIRKRGSAVDVDEVQRRLKLAGERSGTVVLTRVDDRPWTFVCSNA